MKVTRMLFASQMTNFGLIWGIQDLTFISEEKKPFWSCYLDSKDTTYFLEISCNIPSNLKIVTAAF